MCSRCWLLLVLRSSVRVFFVVVRALRLFVRSPPTPRRFRSGCGCFNCSSWGLGRMSRRGAGFRGTSCLIVVICARAAGCCRCCVVLFVVFCGCSCAAPVCAIPPHSSSLSVGLWVFQLFILESWADVTSRGWISRNFVPGCCHMCSRCWLLSVLRDSARCVL